MKTFIDCNKRWPEQKKPNLAYEIFMTVDEGDVFGEFGMEWLELEKAYLSHSLHRLLLSLLRTWLPY